MQSLSRSVFATELNNIAMPVLCHNTKQKQLLFAIVSF